MRLTTFPLTPFAGGSSVWVLCPFGGCRAVVFPSKLQSYVGSVELTAAPCSWTLRYICMEYKALEQLSAQVRVVTRLHCTVPAPSWPPRLAGVGTGGVVQVTGSTVSVDSQTLRRIRYARMKKECESRSAGRSGSGGNHV